MPSTRTPRTAATSDSGWSVRDRIGAILKRDRQPPEVEPSSQVALPTVITADQNTALARLTTIYGRVVPTERRVLAPLELLALYDEWRCLDAVERLAKRRKDSIRTTVLNHLDVTVETDGPAGAATDGAGHYLVAARVAITGVDQVFAWEITDPSPDVDFAALKALADDPTVVDFTRADWTAMTVHVRLYDEARARAAVDDNPHLAEVMATVSTPGRRDGRFSVRPAK